VKNSVPLLPKTPGSRLASKVRGVDWFLSECYSALQESRPEREGHRARARQENQFGRTEGCVRVRTVVAWSVMESLSRN